MQKILIIVTLGLLLSGCTWVHRMNIEQGNIVTQEMVRQLHVGMTYQEVKNILGSPVLLNTFNDNRIDYVYTYKPGNGRMCKKYMTLLFRNGILIQIKGNMYSMYIK